MFLNFLLRDSDPAICLSCFSYDSQCGCSYSFNSSTTNGQQLATQLLSIPPTNNYQHQPISIQSTPPPHHHSHHRQHHQYPPPPPPPPPPSSSSLPSHPPSSLAHSIQSTGSSSESTITSTLSSSSSSSSANGHNYYSTCGDNLQNHSYLRHYHHRSNYFDSESESISSANTTTTNHQGSDYGPVLQLYDESNYFGFNYHLCHSTKSGEFTAETTFSPTDANQVNGITTSSTNGDNSCTYHSGSSNQSYTFSNHQIESTTSELHHHHHHHQYHHSHQQHYLQYQQYHHQQQQPEQLYMDTDGNSSSFSPNIDNRHNGDQISINSDEVNTSIIRSEGSTVNYDDYEMIIDANKISTLNDQQSVTCDQSNSPTISHQESTLQNQQQLSPVTTKSPQPQVKPQPQSPTSPPSIEVTSTTTVSSPNIVNKINPNSVNKVKISQLEISTSNLHVCDSYQQQQQQQHTYQDQNNQIYQESKWLVNHYPNNKLEQLAINNSNNNNNNSNVNHNENDQLISHLNDDHHNNNNGYTNDCLPTTLVNINCNHNGNNNCSSNLTDSNGLALSSTVFLQSNDHYINSSSSMDDHSPNIDFTRFWVNEGVTELTSCQDYFDLKSRIVSESSESYIML